MSRWLNFKEICNLSFDRIHSKTVLNDETSLHKIRAISSKQHNPSTLKWLTKDHHQFVGNKSINTFFFSYLIFNTQSTTNKMLFFRQKKIEPINSYHVDHLYKIHPVSWNDIHFALQINFRCVVAHTDTVDMTNGRE